MPSDFYLVLGISRNANVDKIKKAYRRAVKQYHPDTKQSAQSPEKFREIQEAYETLADEERRRRYDTELIQKEAPARAERASKTISQRQSLWDGMRRYSSFVDEFFDGFLPGFFHKERYRSPVKDLYLEAILTPREAAEGGMCPVAVPVIGSCPRCLQSVFGPDIFCPVCSGNGRIQSKKEFSLTIPPNTSNGTEITLSLEDIGLTNVRLHIRVFVDPDLDEDQW